MPTAKDQPRSRKEHRGVRINAEAYEFLERMARVDGRTLAGMVTKLIREEWARGGWGVTGRR